MEWWIYITLKFENQPVKNQLVNIDPEIMSGTPVFAGTRVPIKNLFDYIETGETLESFLDDFPTVKRQQTIKVLNIALKLIVSKGLNYENSSRRMRSAKIQKRLRRV